MHACMHACIHTYIHTYIHSNELTRLSEKVWSGSMWKKNILPWLFQPVRQTGCVSRGKNPLLKPSKMGNEGEINGSFVFKTKPGFDGNKFCHLCGNLRHVMLRWFPPPALPKKGKGVDCKVLFLKQVIQVVTFSSSSWRSFNLCKDHVFTIPERSQRLARKIFFEDFLTGFEGLKHLSMRKSVLSDSYSLIKGQISSRSKNKSTNVCNDHDKRWTFLM